MLNVIKMKHVYFVLSPKYVVHTNEAWRVTMRELPALVNTPKASAIEVCEGISDNSQLQGLHPLRRPVHRQVVLAQVKAFLRGLTRHLQLRRRSFRHRE